MDNSRTEKLIGKENIEKLRQKRVTIVGCGGVGGYTAVFLARAGIEKFTLIDFDKISPSNVNRQVIAFNSTIGKVKVDALKDMILDIYERAEVETFNMKLDATNVKDLIKNCDVVVDAIDIVKDKLALIIYCKKNNINIISAMGAGNRYDIPHFFLTDIFSTHDDGLAKVIRKGLRENGVDSLEVVISDSKPIKTSGEIASISYYPASIGATIASAIVNKIIDDKI